LACFGYTLFSNRVGADGWRPISISACKDFLYVDGVRMALAGVLDLALLVTALECSRMVWTLRRGGGFVNYERLKGWGCLN
jgi:hypothetical protein